MADASRSQELVTVREGTTTAASGGCVWTAGGDAPLGDALKLDRVLAGRRSTLTDSTGESPARRSASARCCAGVRGADLGRREGEDNDCDIRRASARCRRSRLRSLRPDAGVNPGADWLLGVDAPGVKCPANLLV